MPSRGRSIDEAGPARSAPSSPRPSTDCWVARSRTAVPPRPGRPAAPRLVVVDETSMVSLPLLTRLLDAVRPERAPGAGGRPLPARQHRGGHGHGRHGRPGGVARSRRRPPSRTGDRTATGPPVRPGSANRRARSGHPGRMRTPVLRPAVGRCGPRCTGSGPTTRPGSTAPPAGGRRRPDSGRGRAWPDDGPAALAAATRIKVWPPCARVPSDCSNGPTRSTVPSKRRSPRAAGRQPGSGPR